MTQSRPTCLLGIICAALLAGCGHVPGLETKISDEVKAAPYPSLLPARDLPVAPEQRLSDTSEAELDARGARLSQRARDLQQVSPQETQ